MRIPTVPAQPLPCLQMLQQLRPLSHIRVGRAGGNTLIQIPVHKAVVSGTGITRTTLIVTVDEEARKASADMGTSAGEILPEEPRLSSCHPFPE